MKHERLIRLICLLTALLLLCPSALAYEKLQRGSSGEDVLAMQQALKFLGYNITLDGKYGYESTMIIKSFQKKYGLTADGVAGEETLHKLYELAPAFAPKQNASSRPAAQPAAAPPAAVPVQDGSKLMQGMEGEAVRNMQKALQSLGYRVTADGKFGPATASTVREFQRKYGLTADGVAGKNTLQKLFDLAPSFAPHGSAASPQPTQAPTQAPTAAPAVLPTVQPTAAPAVNPPAVDGSKFMQGMEGEAVRNMQKALQSLGYRVTADGKFGPATASTVREFQRKYGLTADGVAGKETLAILYGLAPSFAPKEDPPVSATPAPTAAPQVSGPQARVVTGGGSLNLRSAARDNASILKTIPDGTVVLVAARGDTWSLIVYEGVNGYVMSRFLSFGANVPTATPAATPTATPVPTAVPAAGANTALVTTSGGTLNFRSQPSATARVIAAIPNGSIVTVQSRGTTWCAVIYNGQSGHVMTKFLTFLGGAASVTPAATSAPTAEPQGGPEEEDPSSGSRNLKKGMTGSDVTWLQTRLKELGYSVTVTNVYDDATYAAVKAFQTKNGMTVDGCAGSQTFALLRSGNARRATDAELTYATLRIDDTGSGVTSLQNALKALGYRVSVNGTFDVDTHNAVVAFQQRNGLVISGIADGLTRTVLEGGGGKPYSTPVETLSADAGKMAGPSVSQIKLLHWQNEIKPKVKSGQAFTVYDPNTGLGWKLVFYSLGRHADSQPASWRDTQIMNRSFGNSSWTIHPVYVLLPTGQWTIATMHNRPHLYGSITDNGFGGHLCVHFLRDMAEAQKNDPDYGVNNQVTLRNAWKALTGETIAY